jgi:hypothetical protein
MALILEQPGAVARLRHIDMDRLPILCGRDRWGPSDHASSCLKNVSGVRIPMMPPGHTEVEASTCSDLMPPTVLR